MSGDVCTYAGVFSLTLLVSVVCVTLDLWQFVYHRRYFFRWLDKNAMPRASRLSSGAVLRVGVASRVVDESCLELLSLVVDIFVGNGMLLVARACRSLKSGLT